MAGVACVELAAQNVREVESVLRAKYAGHDEFLRLLGVSNVILNGDNVLFLQGPRTPLKDGDELCFFPPIGGG